MNQDSHGAAVGPAPPGPPRVQLVLEEYKAYLSDLGNIGARYTTANGFYVSIISAFLAILALAKKGEALERLDLLLYIAVPIFACLLCVIWRETMIFYSALFKTKFDVLREMENDLPFKTFAREEKLRVPGRRLIKNEEWIPIILGLPFVVILLYRIATISGLWPICK